MMTAETTGWAKKLHTHLFHCDGVDNNKYVKNNLWFY